MDVLSKPNLRTAMEPKRVQISFPTEPGHILSCRQADIG